MTGAFSQTNNCTSIAVNGSCTVTVKFTPTAATNTGTLTVNSNANNNPLTVGLSGSGITSTTNIALNKPATASSSYQTYVAANVTDGNTSSYWESTDGAAYPQTISVDLGSTQSIGSVTLDLPPSSRLGHPHRDAVGPRQHQRHVLQPARRLGRVHLQPVDRQHGDDQPAVRDQRPVRAAELHRQHRLVRGPAVGVRGLPRRRVNRRAAARLTASPSSVSFGSRRSARPAPRSTVTVSNPGSTAASMSSVGVTGPFSRVQQLRHLPRGGRLLHGQRDVRADRRRRGDRNPVGDSSAPGSPLTVALSGTGTTTQHQPGAQRPGHRVQLHPDLRARQRRRREHQHVLGGHQRRLADAPSP